MRPSDPITYFARTTFRNEGRRFGIRRADRRHHLYVIGATGTGKSTLLRTLILQDMWNGEGCALFDPHGDLAEEVVSCVPACRQSDLLYLDVPAGRDWHFNPLAGVPEERQALAAAGLVEVFKKLWSDEWGPRLEHILRNVAFTLLATPDSSLGDIPRLLADREWRRGVVGRVTNDEVRSFWRDEYERYSPAFRAVVTAPLLNKVGAFLTDPLLNSILTGPRSSFDLRKVMDEGKILIVNLSRGRIGEGPASLLGSLLVSSIGLVAFGRANMREEERRDFYLYLDEFHTFATLSLANMLSELRKYRLSLILAHQYLSQLSSEVRDAVWGNAGTFISFRVGALDAPLVAQVFEPTFGADDLLSLPNHHIYLRLMVGREVGKPFSARTLLASSPTSRV